MSLSGDLALGETVNDRVFSLWNEWVKNNHDQPLKIEDLQGIREELLNSGITSHPYLTYLILKEAKRRMTKNTGEALKLLEYFEDFYRHISPEPYFLSARIYLQQQGNFSTGIVKILEGLNVYFRNFIYFLETIGNIFTYIFAGFLIATVVFIILMILKYLKGILHDFSDLFPSFVPAFASYLLGITILFAPVIFNVGTTLTVIFWLLVLSGYLTTRERIFVYTLGILLIVFPFLLNFYGSFIISAAENGIVEMELVRNGYWDEKLLNELEKLHKANPENKNIKFSLASVYKKSGRLNEAMEIYQDLLRDGYLESYVLTNIGNIHLADGRIDLAINSYREAIGKDESLAEPHYNLGQILVLKDPFGSEGMDELNRARELAPELISYYTKIFDGKNIHRRAIDMTIKKSYILSDFFKFNPVKIYVFTPAIPVFLNLKTEWTASLFGFILLIGTVMMTVIQNRFRMFSSYCIKCGGIVCSRCTIQSENPGYCNDCLKIYIQKSITDQREVYRHERKSKIRQGMEYQVLRLINIFLPGSGLIYRDYTFSGLFILIIIFSLFFRILIGINPISYHINFSYISPLILNSVLIFFILIFYVVAQLLYYRSS